MGAEFKEQVTAIVRDYKGDGQYLRVHRPDIPGRFPALFPPEETPSPGCLAARETGSSSD